MVNDYVNIQIDKENEDVIYSDEKHIYLSKKDGNRFTSVTELIHKYAQPFDANFWSSYKACEALLLPEVFSVLKSVLLKTKIWKDDYFLIYNIDKTLFQEKKKEILQSYEDKKNIACERGTGIHLKQENLFYNKDNKVKKYVPGEINIKKNYYKLDIDKAVYPEFLVSHYFDEHLKIAGQIDLLIKDGNDIYIIDWKTNAKITLESYYDRNTRKRQMMKFPIDNVQDCNFYHYSLQLSLYAYLIQQDNPKLNIKKLAIVHFDHDGNEVEYQCEYFKEEVAKMLFHYRRTTKIEKELNKDKPIIF